jgi:PAT family beta-lactamase induction signal transducer AmpG
MSALPDATAGTPAAAPAPRKETWREALFNRRMLICVFTGFSSGLPLYLHQPACRRGCAPGAST